LHNPEIIHIIKEYYCNSYSSQLSLSLKQSVGIYSGHNFAVWEKV